MDSTQWWGVAAALIIFTFSFLFLLYLRRRWQRRRQLSDDIIDQQEHEVHHQEPLRYRAPYHEKWIADIKHRKEWKGLNSGPTHRTEKMPFFLPSTDD